MLAVPAEPPKQRNQNTPSNKGGILGAAKPKTRDAIDAQVARVKRWFHRGGQVRFSFQDIDLTPQTAELLSLPSDAPPRLQNSPQLPLSWYLSAIFVQE